MLFLIDHLHVVSRNRVTHGNGLFHGDRYHGTIFAINELKFVWLYNVEPLHYKGFGLKIGS